TVSPNGTLRLGSQPARASRLKPSGLTAMFTAYANYWDFRGRANRSEYWLFTLLNFLLGVFAGILDRVAFHDTGLFGPLGLFVIFATLIPNLSVSFRRLHDLDKSAWWFLIAFIPIVGGLVLFVFTLLPGTRARTASAASRA